VGWILISFGENRLITSTTNSQGQHRPFISRDLPVFEIIPVFLSSAPPFGVAQCLAKETSNSFSVFLRIKGLPHASDFYQIGSCFLCTSTIPHLEAFQDDFGELGSSYFVFLRALLVSFLLSSAQFYGKLFLNARVS